MDVETADNTLLGLIVSQNPAAGTSVAVGTDVDVGVYIPAP
jgi:beta-lactam-binding protein with PASTA domain